MKYLEIRLEDNKSVLVDESAEIKEGDIATIPSYNGLVVVGELDDMPYSTPHRNWQGLTYDTCFDVEEVSKFTKIIATINHSISLDVPMVVVEDEVEIITKTLCEKKGDENNSIDLNAYALGVVDGYKVRQQKGVYSEADIKTAIRYGFNQTEKTFGKYTKEFIQSLSREYIELETRKVLKNKCIKCGLNLIESEGSTPICNEYECLGIVLATKTLEEFSNEEKIKTNRVNGQLMAYIKPINNVQL